MKKIILLIALFFYFMISYAQPGKLDSSFGDKGWVTIDFPKINYYFENALQILPQDDGSFVVSIDDGRGEVLLGNFNSDGTLNKKFGKEGYSAPMQIDLPVAIKQQPDGKIIMAGTKRDFSTYPNRADFVLARYNTDGTLDKTFKGNGKLTADYRFANVSINELAIQPDGKIIVAGNTDIPPNMDTVVVARYNVDGTPDKSFNEDGKLIYNSSGVVENVSSVATQSDGKIIITGTIFVPLICPECGPEDGNTEFVVARFNSDGSLDSGFGEDGSIKSDIGSLDNNFYCILQNDGKIVVTGTAGSSTNYDLTLGRYNSDGSPDLSFGENGKTVTDLGYNDYISSVVLQSNGKILVTAWTGGNVISNSKNFALARYNSDGSPDTGFDIDGKVITNFRFNDFANSVAIQKNGKIAVAGGSFDTTANTLDYAFAMYNTDGSSDNNFSEDGKIIGYIPVGRGNLNSIAVQTDGKIVVAGTALDNLLRNDFFISRYNPDGSRDTAFSRDGRQFRSFGYKDAVSGSLVIQTDGKIVVAGSVFAGKNPDTNVDTSSFVVARYNTDGSADSTFDNDGIQVTDFGKKYLYNIASCVTIQDDGKIVVGGTSGDTAFHFDMAIARYNTNGNLDSSFSENGKQTAGFGSGESRANSIAVDSNKKIVVAGRNNANSEIVNFAIARFNSNGSLDNTFSEDGKQTTNFGDNFSSARSLTIQRDGRIVVAGRVVFDNNSDFALVRYNRDGSLDNTFDADGKSTTDFGLNESASSVNLQTDGKIVVVGEVINASFMGDIALARYDSDGSPDSSFDAEGKLTSDFGGDEGGAAAAIFKDKLYVSRNNIIAVYKLTDENKTSTVTLSIPYNIVKYTSPAKIKLNAAATDEDGTITKVEFYNGTTLLHTEYASPYGFYWVNVPVGNYTLTVKATDNDGNVVTSNAIEVSVITNKAPAVSITLPPDNVIYGLPASVYISATASDEDGSIAKVAFYNGADLLNTQYVAPYGYLWKDVPAGNYTLTAVATDNSGLSSTSAEVQVSVVNSTTPMVSITSPADNTVFTAPASIKINATASDPDGVNRVEFYNGSTLLHTEYKAAYTYNWNNIPTGNYLLSVNSINNNGAVIVSDSVRVSVVDNNAPTVSIISPSDNQTFEAPATIGLHADAQDADGAISKVEFYVNGDLAATEYSFPYRYLWSDVQAGTYTITAKATDNSGAETTSDEVTISVVDAGATFAGSTTENTPVVSKPVSKKADLSNMRLELKLSPNPVNNILNVSIKGQQNKKSDLYILSASGVVIKHMRSLTSTQVPLNVSSLVKGVYIIKVISGDKVMYRQFVKL